jgi:hypothetical protein
MTDNLHHLLVDVRTSMRVAGSASVLHQQPSIACARDAEIAR